MGMPILTVEVLRQNSPKVAVVNEAFAQKLLAGNPIGKRVRLLENDTWVEVVGVSASAKNQGVARRARYTFYICATQPAPAVADDAGG
jgi:hypothetical protein